MKSVSAIEAKFLRKGVSTHLTKLWKEMDEPTKQIILDKVNLHSAEFVILNYFPNTAYFWILTNNRLIVINEDKFQYLPISEIKKVELSEIFDNQVSKQQNTGIHILINDEYIRLSLEPDTWPIIYDILKFVTS